MTLNSENSFSVFASNVVSEILLPNLIWRAGRYVFTVDVLLNIHDATFFIRTAAAIRTAAMTGLQVLLQSKESSDELLKELSADILPQVNIILEKKSLVEGLSFV